MRRLMGTGSEVQRKIPLALPKHARDWLTWALDPFHDTDVEPAGIPDGEDSRVIHSLQRGLMDIRRPAFVPAGSPWQCHIFSTPVLENCLSQTGTIGVRTINFMTDIFLAPPTLTTTKMLAAHSPEPGSRAMGYLVILTAAAGTPMGLCDVSSTTHEIQVWSMDQMYQQRICAAGFEVVNTTAALYKGGLATAYRIPTSTVVSDVMTSGGPVILPLPATNIYLPVWCTPSPADVFVDVPGTREIAVDYPNSATWEAELGAYCVLPVDTKMRLEAPHYRRLVATKSLVFPDEVEVPCSLERRWTLGAPVNIPGAPTKFAHPTNLQNCQPKHTQQCDRVGLFMVGLDSSTTLTLAVKAIVEVAPNASDPAGATLITLSEERPPACPEAIRLYELLSLEMPAGCPRSLNPAGEWWKLIADKMRTIAPLIAPVVKTLVPQTGPIVDAVLKRLSEQQPTPRAAIAAKAAKPTLAASKK